jgi:dihydroflavonol-4-reductase
MSVETVLVTGGTGYLARWCIQLLLERGYAVHATVRDPSREATLRSLFAAAGDTERLRVFTADLLSDDGWQRATDTCDYVLHVASPFPPAQPKDADELIVPARDGTVRVLGAAYAAGVRRVVVTSSTVAVRNAGRPGPGRPLDEEDWASLDNRKATPYIRSKVIAERAAWDYAKATGSTQRLSVVNPGAIIGPLLGAERSYSLQTIDRLLAGSMPAIPRLGFPLSDVRDLADLHIRAMTSPAAAGQRFLGTGPFCWLSDIGAILREELGAQAAKVPTRQAPNTFVRLAARFDPSIRSVIAELGKRTEYSARKAETLLGWKPRPIRESVLDCARSILADGTGLTSPNYRSRHHRVSDLPLPL